MIELPNRQEYEHFLERFSQRLKEQFPDVCAYVYGGFYDKEQFVPGISDIDGGLIVPGKVRTDKKKCIVLADIFSESLEDREIDFDFNLLDRQTNQDGRFLSYHISMTDYIKRHAKTLSGPSHYLRELNGLDYRNEDLKSAAMVFRSIRNHMLTSTLDARRDYGVFTRGVIGTLRKASKFPKQLILVKHGELLTNKAVARARLEEILDNPDLSLLTEINSLLRNPRRLEKELRTKYRATELLIKSLEVVEIMVQAYLLTNPEVDYGFETRM